MQEITPCLWFDDQAEEAAKFHVSIFKNSKLGALTCYGDAPKSRTAATHTIRRGVMKYLLLVHHNEDNFLKFSEAVRKDMLAESVQLTHQLHANGQ